MHPVETHAQLLQCAFGLAEFRGCLNRNLSSLFCPFWKCLISLSTCASARVWSPELMVSRATQDRLHCVRRPECCEVGLSRAFRVLCSKNVSCHARHLCGCEPRSAICAQQTGRFGGRQCSLVFSRNAELRRFVDKNLISSLSLPDLAVFGFRQVCGMREAGPKPLQCSGGH